MKATRTFCLALSFIIIFLFSFKVYGVGSQGGAVFFRNREKSKMIALTFDDGPHPRYTPQILDILQEYGITATFFVIGVNAVNYPDAMERLIDSGCEIGNHTYSHCVLNGAKAACIEEIKECEERIARRGNRSKLLRPPEGKLGTDTLAAASELGYDIVLWSIDTLDWNHNSPTNIANTVLNSVKGGDIILMHDYISHGSPTCDALRLMIPELLGRGYSFVSVSELIS